MTAHELVASIFSREQEGVAQTVRRITQAQFDYLVVLVRREAEGEIRNGQGGSIVWMPGGEAKYVLTAPPPGRKVGTLARLSNATPTGMGSLF